MLGIVITDVVIVQRLTDCIWVGLDSVHFGPHIERVTRLFFALKLGIHELGSYYKSLKPDNTSPLESRYFPSRTTYPSGDESVNFKYVGYLEDGFDCVTLRARTCTERPRDIVVKFVDRYGATAHVLLANEGLAPKLLYCEPPSSRHLFMVVMEYIEDSTLTTAKESMDQEARDRARSEIDRALDLLHQRGFVFGDLRSPNILAKTTGEVKLIDFNWAGVVGQVKYPYLISKDIKWPKGVEGLANIECDHDRMMLKQLF